ncbi:MAG: dihydroneopterin aldolase [Ginsengibacter sp.]
MITIHLERLLFTAYHGIHKEEKILGNEYEVDCKVEFHEGEKIIDHIDDTINYVEIYSIIKERMKTAKPLLEAVIMQMGNEIYDQFPQVKSIHISIKKLHPPIAGMQGSVGVSWNKQF